MQDLTDLLGAVSNFQTVGTSPLPSTTATLSSTISDTTSEDAATSTSVADQAVFTGSLQFSLDGATDAQITSQGRGYQITTAVELTLAAHSHVQVSEYTVTETCKMKLVLICSRATFELGSWHLAFFSCHALTIRKHLDEINYLVPLCTTYAQRSSLM